MNCTTCLSGCETIKAIFKRELKSYFITPVAYVFLIAFILAVGIFTFQFGQFFSRGQADLIPMFSFHPWLYMVFVPAITMRLWSEERKSGTLELLLTLPVTVVEAVVAKFLAAWAFAALALLLTVPYWLMVSYLGQPDHGVILASYLASLLMVGSFLAIGSAVSALTQNQVVAFTISVMLFLLLNLSGSSLVADYLQKLLPEFILDTLKSFSFLTNFDLLSKGLVDFRAVFYFISIIVFGLFANTVFLEDR